MKIIIAILALVVQPLLAKCYLQQTESYLDSIKIEIKKADDDSTKVKLYDRLAYKYSKINPELGLKYSKDAKQLSEKIKWKKGIALSLLDMGLNQAQLSQNDEALTSYNSALLLYIELKDDEGISAIYSNMSAVYKVQSNYPKSLEFAFKALKYRDEIPDRTTAILLENIGTIYFEQKEYVKTVKYYNDAAEIYGRIGDKGGIARNLGNNGIVLDAKGNYNQALNYHLRALKINTDIGNDNGVLINYANIGLVYSHLKQYIEALKYQEKALKLSEEFKSKTNIAINLGNIGETYYAMATDSNTKSINNRTDLLNKSINYLEKAIEICKSIKFSGPQLEFSEYLSNAYAKLNNFEKAYQAQLISQQLKDITHSEQDKVEIKKLETIHEIDLKNKDIVIKEKELQIEKLAAENKKNERNIWILSVIFISLLSTFVVRKLILHNRRQKNKLDDIAHIQSHDIRGPVASILGIINSFNTEDTNDPINLVLLHKLKEASKLLDNQIKDIVLRSAGDK